MAQEYREQEGEQLELFSYDPVIILRDILKRWYLIVAAALLVGMAAFVGTEVLYQPTYTTDTTFVVTSRGDATTVYKNLDVTTELASVFSEVLNSSLLRQKILDEVNITSFDGRITAKAVEDTNLLTMRVTDHDPRTAFLVTRAVVRHHGVVTEQVMGDVVLEVLQAPVVPSEPSNPMHARRNMERGALLAALAVFVLLGVASFMKDTVRSKVQAESKLEERVLGEIVHARKYHSLQTALQHAKTSILVTDPATSFYFVEQIRKLRKRLEHYMPEGGKVLMVTSALENEGKSTVAVNLALSMAQKHKKVLLIDGDLHRPACCKVLEQDRSGAGTVSEVIRGERPFRESVCRCGRLKNLSLLLEWHERANATDLINSFGMEALLDAARREYDFIIVDAPPMTAAADAECMADLVDGSVLVIEQNRARAAVLNESLDILHGAKARVLGCVLNNVYRPVLTDLGHYGYGQGYGYDKGYYGGYEGYGRYHREGGLKEEAGMRHE